MATRPTRYGHQTRIPRGNMTPENSRPTKNTETKTPVVKPTRLSLASKTAQTPQQTSTMGAQQRASIMRAQQQASTMRTHVNSGPTTYTPKKVKPTATATPELMRTGRRTPVRSPKPMQDNPGLRGREKAAEMKRAAAERKASRPVNPRGPRTPRGGPRGQ